MCRPPSFEQFLLVYFYDYDFNTCHCCIYGGWSSLCCRCFPSLLHFRSLRACSMANLRPWRANRRTRKMMWFQVLAFRFWMPEPKVGLFRSPSGCWGAFSTMSRLGLGPLFLSASAASRAFLLLAPRGLLARNSFRLINRLATKDNVFVFGNNRKFKFVNKNLCRRWVRNLIN